MSILFYHNAMTGIHLGKCFLALPGLCPGINFWSLLGPNRICLHAIIQALHGLKDGIGRESDFLKLLADLCEGNELYRQ